MLTLSKKSPIIRYGFAFFVSAIVLAIHINLGAYLGARAPFLLSLLLIALTAAILGTGPAAIVLVAAAGYGFYYLLHTDPTQTAQLHGWAALYTFIAIGAASLYFGNKARIIFGRAAEAELKLNSGTRNRSQVNLERIVGLFQQAPGFMTILSGPDHIYEFQNEAHRRFTGYRSVLGKKVREAFPEVTAQAAGLHDVLDRVYQTGQPYSAYEVPISLQRKPDSPLEQLFMDIVYQPILDDDGRVTGIFVEGLDVTDKKKAEERAREASERLTLAIDAAQLGTFYCPMPLNKIYWNATCKAHFFLPEDAEIDFDVFYSRIHPDDRERTKEAVNTAVFNKSDYDVEYRTLSPDGRTRWIRAKGRAYYGADGTPTRFDGITIDITRQKQAEENLHRANRQKDDFLAMLAHELRNPLAPISAAASLLTLPGVDQSRVARTSEIIGRQVKHMAELLDDLLDVSRVTRGMVTLNKSMADIKHVVSAAAEQVLPLVEARGHSMSVHLPSEAAYVRGDEKRLIQIVVNLLTNAAKYTPEKGAIEVSVETDVGQVVISVKDNGIGMPGELIGHVFDLFVQGARSPDRQQGGLGLGLALVKSLVELHDGQVAAQSQGTGRGSVFTVSLPKSKPAGLVPHQGNSNQVLLASNRPLKIMIVDDNADAASAIGMVLEAVGHEVFVENNPVVALKRAKDLKPDLYLLDIGMPEMSGNQLVSRLRADPETGFATFVAVSGYAQEHDRLQSAAAGFHHHLAKPLDMEKLSEIMRTLPV